MISAIGFSVVATTLACILAIPELGLVLCAVAAPLAKGIVQPYLGSIDLTALIYLATALSIGFRLLLGRQRLRLPPMGFNMLVGVFLLFLGMGFVRSPLPVYARQILFRFVALDLGLLYMVVICLTTRSRLLRTMSLFAGVGLSYGAALLIGVVLIPGLLGQPMALRGALEGTAVLDIGLILAMSLVFALTFRVVSRKPALRAIATMAIAVVTSQLIALNSRGPVLAFAAGAVVWGLVSLRSARWWRLVIPTSTVLASALMSLAYLPSEVVFRYNPVLLDPSHPSATSIAARLSMVGFARANVWDWFVGGAGLFGYAYHYSGKASGYALFGDHPHNLFLDVYASLGAFGAATFVALLLYVVVVALRVAVKRRRSSLTWMARALLGALAAGLVSSWFSMSLIDTRLLWFIGGCVLCLGRDSEHEQDMLCRLGPKPV